MYTGFQKNNTLQRLYLDHNNLFNDYLWMIEDVINTNTCLQTLSLASCNIQDEGMLILSDGLKINRYIHSINLKDNSISNTGARAFIKAISLRNGEMKYINLANNLIATNVGSQILSEISKFRLYV